MTNSGATPIGQEMLEKREQELNSKLPELYPSEAERQIAEQILVPQLRSVIAEALSNFVTSRGVLASVPPAPAELPNLCAGVDKALDANRNLLDSEGLGKPLFEYVQSVRESVRAEMEEAFRAHCRLLLDAHGVTDRSALLSFGIPEFIRTDFSPYGKGTAFANLILGEVVKNLSLAHLCRIADILGWPEPNRQEKLQAYRSALAVHGIANRATLLAKGQKWFLKADFPPYGKGRAFAILVLGELIPQRVRLSLAHLRRIADELGWEEPDEDEKLQSYRDSFAVHEVTDRATLLAKGSTWFKNADFPPYGKGGAFAGLVLDERVDYPSADHICRIADKLGWFEKSDLERLEGYRSVLAVHGITNRNTLLAKGSVWFMNANFPPFGKGFAFANLILGQSVNKVTLVTLCLIADILGWPEPNRQEKLQVCRSTLAVHGITNRATLLAKGSTWFLKADFPPYGKGIAFASQVLGERVHPLSFAHLCRIADALGWHEESDEEKLKAYRFALVTHDITDRNLFLSKGSVWFQKTEFSPFGKGIAFASLILAETVKKVTSNHFRRIADILFPERK